MERRNEYWDYWLATQLTPLRFIEVDKTVVDSIVLTFPAVIAIDQIEKSGYSGLELCYEQIIALRRALDEVQPKRFSNNDSPETFTDNFNKQISQYEKTRIVEALTALETALSIQFNQMNTYRVTAKGTHDPRKLIESPKEAFGKYWNGLSPIARTDWVAGAKCLAFELPTACGFHVVRSMEAVVVDCLKKLGKIPAKRDLGHYVELMREAGVAEEAIDIVDQIRKHHRNPLMHPEDILDVPMAMSLLDLCRVAIVSIINYLATGMQINLEGEQADLAVAEQRGLHIS